MATEERTAATVTKKKAIAREVKAVKAKASAKATNTASKAKYPRHTVEKALRIPRAIIEQNAGKDCSDKEAASYIGVGVAGPFRLEVSSATKYGFLTRPKPGFIGVSERARQAIRPQKPGDDVEALRQAVMEAPEISEVYKHYRGEDLPDGAFLANALVDKFHIPIDKVSEFKSIFESSLQAAQLIEVKGDKYRVLDATSADDLLISQ